MFVVVIRKKPAPRKNAVEAGGTAAQTEKKCTCFGSHYLLEPSSAPDLDLSDISCLTSCLSPDYCLVITSLFSYNIDYSLRSVAAGSNAKRADGNMAKLDAETEVLSRMCPFQFYIFIQYPSNPCSLSC